jgi:hypothetical protein
MIFVHRTPGENPMRRQGTFLFLLLGCLGWALPAEAQAGENGFRVTPSRIHLAGEISCVLSTDLDGDGAGEAVVGYLADAGRGEPRKTLAFFRAGPDRRYGPEPVREFLLPDDTGVIAFGDVNGDGRADLVFTRRGAVWTFPLQPDHTFSHEPERIVRWPCNLPYSRDRIFTFDLLRDLNRDGRPDILLPTLDGYALFLQKTGGNYPRKPDVSFPLDYGATLSEMFQGRTLGIHYRIPLPALLDINRDGIDDLVFADGNTCWFFPFLPETGTYGKAKVVRLPVRKEGVQFLVSQVDDFDADGLPDVFVMRGVPRKVTFNIDNLFFRGKPGLAFGSREDLVLSHERQIIPPWIMDLDGDGRKEFVTFSQRLSLNSVIDYFVRDRVAVDVSAHPNRGGVFSKDPVVVRKVFLKVEEEEGSPGAVAGDFNGDGREDFVYTPDSTKVHYLLSGGEDLIPAKPTCSLEVPSYGSRVVEDFNRDGRDDLAILYEIRKRRGDLTLLISNPP